jgi:NADH-quinone oxidoreductase subunit J
MQADAIFFWPFSTVLILSALAVILARNPVHSVLFLILAFVNAAGLFLLMGAEFLGMILIVVYVGAVAVLFLFVVMMLDVDFAELKQGFLQYLPIGGLIAFFVALELGYVAIGWSRSPDAAAPAAPPGSVSNTEALGRVLYTQYFFFFQAAGLILLTAMIGAIVLTLRHRVGVKRQNVAEQVARSPATAVEVRKVPSHVGI